MYIEKFLSQVHRKLKEQGILNSKLREDCIEVFEGENVIFKIDAKGGMFYSSDKQFRNIVDKLHDKIQPIVCEVDEYLRAMDNGTELKARDFDMPYIKIAEYNEVVLAGTEHKNGSFEFATWSYKNNSLYHGNYTTDYKGAREDFATRSGLVNKNLLFNKNELVEIYRCIEDTLNNEYEITDNIKALAGEDAENIDFENMEKLNKRYNFSTLASLINASYGAENLAALTILTNSRGYIMPKDFKDDFALFVQYEGEYSAIVSFSKYGDGVISANMAFVKNGDKDNVFRRLHEITSVVGEDGVKIAKVKY